MGCGGGCVGGGCNNGDVFFLLGVISWRLYLMKMEQSVPKRLHIKYRRQGITKNKEYIIIIIIATTTNTTTTHSMDSCGKKCSFSKADDRSAIREIPHILWHPKGSLPLPQKSTKNLSLD
jgi:hypothetical protein